MQGKPSKTARKREQHARQALGERLIELAPERLATIPLDDDLRDAILAATRMKAHGALRRQRQLIGKLMRHVDTTPIEAALAAATRTDRHDKAVFHLAESWRDRIVANGREELERFVAETGRANEELERCVDELARAKDRTARRTIGRRMFRAVHSTLSAAKPGS